MTERPIQIVIVDDVEEVREGLRYLIGLDSGLQVVSAVKSAEELERLMRGDRTEIDLILMDIGLPGTDGIEATAQVKQRHPGVRVLILTVFEDEERILSAIRAGADGYLLKNTRPAELAEQIKQTYQGHSPVSPAVAGRLLHEIRTRETGTPNRDYHLTAREQEILRDVAAGLTYREIAARRGIADSTAKKHILHLYQKLNVTSKVEFVRKVIDEELL
ncbi:MAG: response regulator [Alkalispirochaeta sp.]